MDSVVKFNEEEHYCLIQLDDGKANAVSTQLAQELNGALDLAEEAAKVVIITGRSGKFSAGFDLAIMSQGGEATLELLKTGGRLSLRLLTFPTPVIIAATGHALAMGALLLLSVDHRIGTRGNYKIGLNEVAIGMTLPHFAVALAKGRLANTLLSRATGLAEIYLPDGAVEAGYLDEVVEEADLRTHATALAQRLATLDMAAHRGTKMRIRADMIKQMEVVIESEFSTTGLG